MDRACLQSDITYSDIRSSKVLIQLDTPSIGAFDIVSFDGALFSNSMEVPTVVALLGIFQLGGKTTRPGYEVTQLDTIGIRPDSNIVAIQLLNSYQVITTNKI